MGLQIVVFDLLFPQQLNDDQKMLLTSAFFLPPKPSKEQVRERGLCYSKKNSFWARYISYHTS